ncbi:MAG: hypothetical protein JXM70_11265 [Pirellulales bacterium]|nr:hypothetical protein [Pirellulales bacterium]
MTDRSTPRRLRAAAEAGTAGTGRNRSKKEVKPVNKRRHFLGLTVLGIGLIAVGVLIIRGFILKPAQKIDDQVLQLRQKLSSIQQERTAFFAAEKEVKQVAQRAFSDDPDHALATAGALITRYITQAGLPEDAFSRTPFGPARLRGTRELGWAIQGEGPLDQVIDLLFLLDQYPALHQIQNLAVSPGDRPGRIRIRFRYLILVFDPAPAVSRAEMTVQSQLDSPERQRYAGIVDRDLFRPYIRRPPRPPESPPPPPPPSAPVETPLSSYKIVSLSSWNGHPEIHLRDLSRSQTTIIKPGETLLNGQAVMVDYRPLPHPNHPSLISDSRLIWKIDGGYWAVERGDTLADKYQLPSCRLPPALSNCIPVNP